MTRTTGATMTVPDPRTVAMLAEFTVADFQRARECGLDVMDEITWRVLCWQICVFIAWGGRARWTSYTRTGAASGP